MQASVSARLLAAATSTYLARTLKSVTAAPTSLRFAFGFRRCNVDSASLATANSASLVHRLNEQYDAAGRAFRVEQVAGGYRLLTRRKFAPWLRRLAHVPAESRFSAPALETLAVIAYRQPVPRADIEAVRGVNCGEILR